MSQDVVGGWGAPADEYRGIGRSRRTTAATAAAECGDDLNADHENLLGLVQHSPASSADDGDDGSGDDGGGSSGAASNDEHCSDAEHGGPTGGQASAALKGIAVKSFARQQLSMAYYFATHAKLSIPIFIIWVASFGGSLHGPVTTFFLLDLGVTEVRFFFASALKDSQNDRVAASSFGRAFSPAMGGEASNQSRAPLRSAAQPPSDLVVFFERKRVRSCAHVCARVRACLRAQVQIGHVGFLIASGPILLAPLYGWFLDRGYKFWSIWVSCLFCGLGCMLRGLAVDWWLA
jgi:hypothetical protein